jgi:hypothetical protein
MKHWKFILTIFGLFFTILVLTVLTGVVLMWFVYWVELMNVFPPRTA